MFSVYVLQNHDGHFYIGHTDNLGNRVASHNRTDKINGKFTRKNGPWTLVWSEEHPNRSSAMQRERPATTSAPHQKFHFTGTSTKLSVYHSM
jgi:predicted GIY-YIG superfamily endonuclease